MVWVEGYSRDLNRVSWYLIGCVGHKGGRDREES